jgi:hypothetical protein
MHRNLKMDPVADELGDTISEMFWGSSTDPEIRLALQQYCRVSLR